MPKDIRVILLEDIPTVGKANDIVSVSEGYARNFLFAHGKAALATGEQLQQVQRRQAAAIVAEQKIQAALQAQAEVLDGTELTIAARAKDGENIFGSITASKVVSALNAQANLKLAARSVILDTPLTTLGSHRVSLRLSPDVEAVIVVTIVAEPGSEPPVDDEL